LDLKDSPPTFVRRLASSEELAAYIFGEAVIVTMAAYFPELEPPRGPFA
jgi:hypothetical protein